MSRRRLNYTGRRKIARSHARVSLHASDGSPHPTFHLDLELGDYRFPPDARVRVEAWRANAVQRWDYGTAGRLAPPPPTRRRLTDVPDSSQFRVEVIAADGTGRLLGASDSLRPAQPQRSLLPLSEVNDLGSEIWRLQFGTPDAPEIPVLQVNSAVPGISDLVRHDPTFRALVMPAVLRNILVHMLFVSSSDPTEDDHPMHEWYLFAVGLSATADFSLPSDPIDRMRWIDSVVGIFAKLSVRAVLIYNKARN